MTNLMLVKSRKTSRKLVVKRKRVAKVKKKRLREKRNMLIIMRRSPKNKNKKMKKTKRERRCILLTFGMLKLLGSWLILLTVAYLAPNSHFNQ